MDRMNLVDSVDASATNYDDCDILHKATAVFVGNKKRISKPRPFPQSFANLSELAWIWRGRKKAALL